MAKMNGRSSVIVSGPSPPETGMAMIAVAAALSVPISSTAMMAQCSASQM
jgi:hypothetical protein